MIDWLIVAYQYWILIERVINIFFYFFLGGWATLFYRQGKCNHLELKSGSSWRQQSGNQHGRRTGSRRRHHMLGAAILDHVFASLRPTTESWSWTNERQQNAAKYMKYVSRATASIRVFVMWLCILPWFWNDPCDHKKTHSFQHINLILWRSVHYFASHKVFYRYIRQFLF